MEKGRRFFVMEILSNYMLEIFFGLVSAGCLAFCRHLWKEKKKIEAILAEDSTRKLREMILDELEPIIEEIHRLQDKVEYDEEEGKLKLALIVNSYKFRLIQLCKTHLRDEFLTQEEFDQLSELYKLYKSLGGNGQAEEYYNKVLRLPIRSGEQSSK